MFLVLISLRNLTSREQLTTRRQCFQYKNFSQNNVLSSLFHFPFTPFRLIIFSPSWFSFKCIFLKTWQQCQGDPLLLFTLHCIYDFRYSHKTERIFVLNSRNQQKHEYQHWEQKYHQKSNLPLNDLSMRGNTPNEEENSCCLTML